MKKIKNHLGYDVYVEFTGHDFILTTENRYEATNTIHLEPHMIAELKDLTDYQIERSMNREL